MQYAAVNLKILYTTDTFTFLVIDNFYVISIYVFNAYKVVKSLILLFLK
jgi:hypothetical protein